MIGGEAAPNFHEPGRPGLPAGDRQFFAYQIICPDGVSPRCCAPAQADHLQTRHVALPWLPSVLSFHGRSGGQGDQSMDPRSPSTKSAVPANVPAWGEVKNKKLDNRARSCSPLENQRTSPHPMSTPRSLLDLHNSCGVPFGCQHRVVARPAYLLRCPHFATYCQPSPGP
jgi:hypothetical protein